ncbi:MAG: GNAT family N-acetyltransferase [Saprospiraceae bacterium]|nr:GNAT family N-acetyltransferase [Saprospiraceae bacterium]
MNIRLKTERLILREVEITDGPFILVLYNTPDFIRFIGDRQIADLQKAEDYIQEKLIRSYAVNGYGLYGMLLKSSGELIGICGLVKRSEASPPDIGFSILPAHYRQGYTLEAARAVLEYAHKELKLNKVLGLVHPENQASIALLKKIGIPEDHIHISLN